MFTRNRYDEDFKRTLVETDSGEVLTAKQVKEL